MVLLIAQQSSLKNENFNPIYSKVNFEDNYVYTKNKIEIKITRFIKTMIFFRLTRTSGLTVRHILTIIKLAN